MPLSSDAVQLAYRWDGLPEAVRNRVRNLLAAAEGFAATVAPASSTEQLADALAGLAWWNDLEPQQRAWWLQQAQSAVPADAWEEFKAREVRP